MVRKALVISLLLTTIDIVSSNFLYEFGNAGGRFELRADNGLFYKRQDNPSKQAARINEASTTESDSSMETVSVDEEVDNNEFHNINLDEKKSPSDPCSGVEYACTEDEMKYLQCDNNKFIERDCNPGTVCIRVGKKSISCANPEDRVWIEEILNGSEENASNSTKSEEADSSESSSDTGATSIEDSANSESSESKSSSESSELESSSESSGSESSSESSGSKSSSESSESKSSNESSESESSSESSSTASKTTSAQSSTESEQESTTSETRISSESMTETSTMSETTSMTEGHHGETGEPPFDFNEKKNLSDKCDPVEYACTDDSKKFLQCTADGTFTELDCAPGTICVRTGAKAISCAHPDDVSWIEKLFNSASNETSSEGSHTSSQSTSVNESENEAEEESEEVQEGLESLEEVTSNTHTSTLETHSESLTYASSSISTTAEGGSCADGKYYCSENKKQFARCNFGTKVYMDCPAGTECNEDAVGSPCVAISM
ncbi:hypothetical protein AX774_g2669 [Zancudomyces culisetae]|uniref:Carbohydrate-binding module family 19 domain-containing protein n=1 Tax=Zancudomyces culisetae TaxID=1213189 RepID=A0A1R1PSB8_ZANCU|nr:hypothetical protein AX774_g2669 [Zancudomyces culisetae]|eukprot:OMH83819.1 hypothetical protein AX774_g2669 [Zancudomyces culisetae]